MKNQSSTEPTCSSTSIIQPVPSTSSSSSLHPSSSFSGSTSLLSQQILTEDEYTSSLDYIIRRDFFPTLGLQQLEEEYLRALDGGDETEIDRTVTRLVQEEERSGKIGATPRTERGENTSNKRQKRESGIGGSYSFNPTSTPGETPLRSQVSNWDQTPISTDRSVSSPVPISRSNPPRRIASGSSKPIDLSLSLSAFQANYTSEDNASFNQLMARNNLKNKEKNSWAFEAERRNNEKRLEFKRREIRECEKGRELMEGAREERKMIEMEKRGLIEASKESDGSEEHLEKEKEKEKDLQIIRTEEEPDNSTSSKDSRPSILQSWKFKALNPFFFPPDSEISTAYQRTSSLPTTFNKTQDSFLLESNRPKVNRPELRVDNMRFPEGWSDEKGKVENEEEDEDGGGSSPSSSRIDKAIRGSSSSSSTYSSSHPLLQSQLPSIQTPRVSGYSFVSPLPTPRPGDLGADRVKQLMTWGKIVGTPRAIRSSSEIDATPSSEIGNGGGFFIPETPRRDELASRLASSKGKSKSRGDETPYGIKAYNPNPMLSVVKSSGRNRKDLSPAARNLFERSSKATGFTSSFNGGRGLGSKSLGNSLLGNRREKDGKTEKIRRKEMEIERERNERLSRRGWSPSPSPKPH